MSGARILTTQHEKVGVAGWDCDYEERRHRELGKQARQRCIERFVASE